MAVLPALQGSGLGRPVLDALLQAARERGEPALSLQAHAAAQSFYAAAGFVPQGSLYEEAGLPHIVMTRRL
jgi:predicted GNAT family N-acyltransferase